MNFLTDKKIVIVSMVATLVMAFVVMVIVNPMIDQKDGLGVIALQLAFDKQSAFAIISSWNIEAFKQWIFTDYIYAFSYVLFFSSLILWLEKSKGVNKSIFPYIALLAGLLDWIENSLELLFLSDTEGFSSTLFFMHSIFATLKWLALPVIVWYIIKLFRMKSVENV